MTGAIAVGAVDTSTFDLLRNGAFSTGTHPCISAVCYTLVGFLREVFGMADNMHRDISTNQKVGQLRCTKLKQPRDPLLSGLTMMSRKQLQKVSCLRPCARPILRSNGAENSLREKGRLSWPAQIVVEGLGVDVTDPANAGVVSASTQDLHTKADLIEAASAVYAAKYGSGYMDVAGEVFRWQCDAAADTFL